LTDRYPYSAPVLEGGRTEEADEPAFRPTPPAPERPPSRLLAPGDAL
jgi:hypothetical protein